MTSLQQRLSTDLIDAQMEMQDAQEELREAEQRAEKIRWKVEYIKSLINDHEEGRTRGGTATRTTPTPGPKKGGTTPDWIQIVLHDAGGPLRIKEVVDRIAAKGLAGPAPDIEKLTKNVSSTLQRAGSAKHPIFKKIDHGTYELVERIVH